MIIWRELQPWLERRLWDAWQLWRCSRSRRSAVSVGVGVGVAGVHWRPACKAAGCCSATLSQPSIKGVGVKRRVLGSAISVPVPVPRSVLPRHINSRTAAAASLVRVRGCDAPACRPARAFSQLRSLGAGRSAAAAVDVAVAEVIIIIIVVVAVVVYCCRSTSATASEAGG